jgi:DNA repair exonuclease SbcCD nuclease subunit
MGRLAKAKIPVFLLYGNHDADSQITKRLTLPDNVQVFSHKQPETFELRKFRVALHGQSFPQRGVTENLVPAYPAPVDASFNIGVLHTGLGGMGGHLNYAPCTLPDLVNKGYDYWALAHVHQGSVLHQNPHVVFCGNLQGRHTRESGPKSATLVTVEEGRVGAVTSIEADVVRWMHVQVTVDGSTHAADVVSRIGRTIESTAAGNSGRLVACRIELSGRTELHDYLLSSREYLIAEARGAALALGEEAAWVERVLVRTEPATINDSTPDQNIPEGLASILGEAAKDEGLVLQLQSEIGDLLSKLPHDLRADLDDGLLRAAVNSEYSTVVAEGSRYLSARLASRGA